MVGVLMLPAKQATHVQWGDGGRAEWGELLLMHGRCRLPQSKPQLLLPTQRERRRPRLEVRLHRGTPPADLA
eukprot:3663853-Rhodomonas_salina.1